MDIHHVHFHVDNLEAKKPMKGPTGPKGAPGAPGAKGSTVFKVLPA